MAATPPYCTTLSFPTTIPGDFIFYLDHVTFDGCHRDKQVQQTVKVDDPKCYMSIVDLTGFPTLPNPDMYSPCVGDSYYVRIYGYPGVYHVHGPTLPLGFTATITPTASYVDIGPYVQLSGYSPYSFFIDQIDGCCTKVATGDQPLCAVNVHTRHLPTVSVSGTIKVCEWEPFTLSATALIGRWEEIETLTWDGPGIGLPSSGSPVLPPPVYPPSTDATLTHMIGGLSYGFYTYTVTTTLPVYTVSPTYTLTGCSATATIPVMVYPVPLPISGPSSICLGSTTFTDATSGGTWSSSNPLCLSINPSTGVATGLTVGAATITYTTYLGGCYVTKDVQIKAFNEMAPLKISCGVGGTATIPTPGPFGTWSSANTAIATVSPIGLVTGIAAGTTYITYTASGGCAYTTLVTVPSVMAGMPVVHCDQYLDPGGVWRFRFTSTAFPVIINYTGDVASLTLGGGICGYRPALVPLNLTSSPSIDITPGMLDTLGCGLPGPIIVHAIHGISIEYGGCKADIDAVCVETRPIGNNSGSADLVGNQESLHVTPNPNTGSFTLSGTMSGLEKATEVSIEIMDMLGKTLFTEVASVDNGSINKKISISQNIANGVYLIKVKANAESKTIRFTLNR